MNVENQNNQAYVENFIPSASNSEKKKMLNLLNSYGDNKWWLSKDEKIIVSEQIKQQYLLIDFNKFKKSIETILKRSVKYTEFDENEFENLKNEIEEKLKQK